MMEKRVRSRFSQRKIVVQGLRVDKVSRGGACHGQIS